MTRDDARRHRAQLAIIRRGIVFAPRRSRATILAALLLVVAACGGAALRACAPSVPALSGVARR
jgi:hypothetical protein